MVVTVIQARWFILNEKGSVLISVLLITALLLGAGVVLLSRISLEVEATKNSLTYQSAVLSGKNGMEEAAAALSANHAYRGNSGFTEDENGVLVKIVVQPIDTSETQWFVETTAKKESYTKIFQGTFSMHPETGYVEKISYRMIK